MNTYMLKGLIIILFVLFILEIGNCYNFGFWTFLLIIIFIYNLKENDLKSVLSYLQYLKRKIDNFDMLTNMAIFACYNMWNVAFYCLKHMPKVIFDLFITIDNVNYLQGCFGIKWFVCIFILLPIVVYLGYYWYISDSDVREPTERALFFLLKLVLITWVVPLLPPELTLIQFGKYTISMRVVPEDLVYLNNT